MRDDFLYYVNRAFEGCKPFVATLLSIIMWIVFPDGAYLTAFYGVVGAMVLDIFSKYLAVAVKCGGFKEAIITKKLYSKTLWRGSRIKIISYLVIFILAGLSYRVSMLEQASIFLATVIYSIIFLREAQSILENLVDAGADLGWLLLFTKNKEIELLKKNGAIEEVKKEDDDINGHTI